MKNCSELRMKGQTVFGMFLLAQNFVSHILLSSKGLNAIAELLIPFKRVFKLYEFKNNYVI